MKSFLKKLLSGVKESEVSLSHREILRNLENLGAVTLHKNRYYQNNGFVIGRLDISSNSTGYINTYDEKIKKDIIVESKDLNGAHIGDIVAAKLMKGKKLKAKISMILKAKIKTSVVYTKSFGGTILGVNIATMLSSQLKASQKSLKELPFGTLLKIDNISNEIVEVIGNISDPSCDMDISLALYNKHKDFPELCETQALSWGNKVDKSFYTHRVDLTHLPFCTIDPVDAKDYDDAIYFDKTNNQIYIAIADVSHYVEPYTPIDKEAKERGFSIYFPHIAIPMLPRSLSENICSLKPNEDRLAYCFKITLDENLNTIKEELFEAIINSKRRYNYDEVDEILESKKAKEGEILQWLLPLFEVTKTLKENRLKKGFDFRSKDLRMSLDDGLNLKSTRFENETSSHSLIEDCMLLANKAAAKRIKRGIFRNHGVADIKKIHQLLDDLTLFGLNFSYESDLVKLIAKIQAKSSEMGIREEIDKLIIKSQKRAEYSPECFGHFGLGFKEYSHFTSPIRRYTDLILHRLLKASASNDMKKFNYLLLNIEETCSSLNDLEREADKVAFDFMDRKFARWAKDRIGQAFKCYISSNDKICIAKLDDDIKGARIYINNYSCDLLQKVMVKIVEVDIPSAKIIGKIVEKLDV